jgi:predicted alpha/beta-fold hydrolase
MKTRNFRMFGVVLSCFYCLGCVQLDFLLFAGEPSSMDDYDFTKEELNGIDPSRITSERIDIPGTSDKLHAIYVERDLSELDPRLSPDDNITVIFSHGNRGNILLYWYRVGYFEDMGFNVVIYDYRGYGASDGETTEANLYQDAEVAYDYAKSKGAGRVFSVGHSMGGCPAIWLCSPESGRKLAGCFTESAFASAEHLINESRV